MVTKRFCIHVEEFLPRRPDGWAHELTALVDALPQDRRDANIAACRRRACDKVLRSMLFAVKRLTLGLLPKS